MVETIHDIDILIKWINDTRRPIWWKHCIRLLLDHANLTSIDQEQLYQIAKAEAGFSISGIDLNDFKAPIKAIGYGEEYDVVTLSCLRDAKNIALLDPKQCLSFSEKGITVIYGDNGAGKSSYCRVLKNCCLTRGQKPEVLGNLLKPSPIPPAITIRYKLGGEEKEISWNADAKTDDIKAIRVFDSAAALHYVSDNDIISYKLPAIQLLETLAQECKRIEELVNTEINDHSTAYSMPQPPEGTDAHRFLVSLNHDCTKEQLEKFKLSEHELESIKNLPGEIAKLKANSAAELKNKLQQQNARLSSLYSFIVRNSTSVSSTVISEFIAKRKEYCLQSKAVKLAREEAFKEMPLKNMESNAWRTLWNAAIEFCKNENQVFPPQEGELCPLCLQAISVHAFSRMKKIQTYIVDTVERDLSTIKTELELMQKKYREISFDFTPYSATIQELGDIFPLESTKNITAAFFNISEAIGKRRNFLLTPLDEEPDQSELPSIDESWQNRLQKQIEETQQHIASLADDASRIELLQKLQQNLNELLGKQQISDRIDLISNEIKRQKRLVFLSRLKSSTNLKTITKLCTEINNKSIFDRLKNFFQEELSYMGFSYYSVSLSSFGRKSEVYWGLRLENNEGPNRIASEGEHKCIALACILAELKADERQSGIIFDDPVTSLDHKWRERIAQRLIEEGEKRQIIIFTHDLAFLILLQEQADKLKSDKVKYVSLTRTKYNTGIVLDQQPWDGMRLKERIKSLNEKLVVLEKIESTKTEDEYQQQARYFYSHLRETWERLVEERLLNGAITRFSRGISTLPLRKLVDGITQNDYDTIERNMTLCSNYFTGHDNASGLQVSIPTCSRIKKDLEELIKYEGELRKRRN
jgi:predicted ATPase, possibly involved in inorganic ion transport